MIELDERVSLLHKVPFFQGVEGPDLQLMARRMTEVSFEAGVVVFREGEAGERLYVLLTGTMHVFVEKHGNVITYGRLGDGECFGEMALIDDSPRSATVKAETLSSCVTLSKQDFLNLLDTQHSIALSMVKSTFGRLSPNPPKDTDGRREGSGRGWVRELQGRWPGLLG